MSHECSRRLSIKPKSDDTRPTLPRTSGPSLRRRAGWFSLTLLQDGLGSPHRVAPPTEPRRPVAPSHDVDSSGGIARERTSCSSSTIEAASTFRRRRRGRRCPRTRSWRADRSHDCQRSQGALRRTCTGSEQFFLVDLPCSGRTSRLRSATGIAERDVMMVPWDVSPCKLTPKTFECGVAQRSRVTTQPHSQTSDEDWTK